MVKLIEIIRANDKNLNRQELLTKTILFSLVVESFKHENSYPLAYLNFANIQDINLNKFANELQVVTANKTAQFYYENFQFIQKNYSISEIETSLNFILKIINKEFKNEN